jgi:hypothetical protein
MTPEQAIEVLNALNLNYEQLNQLLSTLTLSNGLLMFLCVYIVLKDLSKYILSFIKGGL